MQIFRSNETPFEHWRLGSSLPHVRKRVFTHWTCTQSKHTRAFPPTSIYMSACLHLQIHYNCIQLLTRLRCRPFSSRSTSSGPVSLFIHFSQSMYTMVQAAYIYWSRQTLLYVMVQSVYIYYDHFTLYLKAHAVIYYRPGSHLVWSRHLTVVQSFYMVQSASYGPCSLCCPDVFLDDHPLGERGSASIR